MSKMLRDAGSLDLAALLGGIPLGEEHQLMPRAQILEGFTDAVQELDIGIEDVHPEVEDIIELSLVDLPLGQSSICLDEIGGIALGSIAVGFQIGPLDLDERERLYDIILAAGQWSIALVIVLGLAGGFFVARRVLHRIDAMTETSRTIMAGDLSGRLPTAGSEDELDRLAVNLNVMLERIEALMRGFKEVSDNIAHDLKTPLTRLRNRAEEALRSGKNEADYRAALDSTIEESDELIRTFNALLMIARAESGQASTPMIEFDAADIVRGVGELYDPLADEKGLTLKIEAGAPLPVRGNRELVTQALANLVDNAIKYARPHKAEANGMPADVVIAASGEGDRIRLSVSDRGPGVSAGDRERVVQRFVRLEQSRSEPGSGLGLSLASAVAHLHGGELRLEDNGPGLKATLDLPRGGPQLPQPNE